MKKSRKSWFRIKKNDIVFTKKNWKSFSRKVCLNIQKKLQKIEIKVSNSTVKLNMQIENV